MAKVPLNLKLRNFSLALTEQLNWTDCNYLKLSVLKFWTSSLSNDVKGLQFVKYVCI